MRVRVDAGVGIMAFTDWLEIYQSYSAEELAEEITQLKKDIKGNYSGQGVGSVNYQRDLTMIQSRLRAATRVVNERSQGDASNMGEVDFSGVNWGDV